jgi:hypothetical protein
MNLHLPLESELSLSDRMDDVFVFCEPVTVLFQSRNEYVVLICYPYELFVAVKVENSAPCAHHYGLGPAMNGFSAQIACFPLFHAILGARSFRINDIV